MLQPAPISISDRFSGIAEPTPVAHGSQEASSHLTDEPGGGRRGPALRRRVAIGGRGASLLAGPQILVCLRARHAHARAHAHTYMHTRVHAHTRIRAYTYIRPHHATPCCGPPAPIGFYQFCIISYRTYICWTCFIFMNIIYFEYNKILF